MVNGYCFGGAFTQLFSCDFAIAAEDAIFGLSEVNWGIEDFAAAALLLGGAGLALEAVLRFVRGTGARLGLGLAIGVALMLVWAELAVGLFH